MKHRIARTAALALAGATLFTSTPAFADPTVTSTLEGEPIADEATGMLGQAALVTGSGCLNPEPGSPAYMGQFVTPGDDPAIDPAWHTYETQVDETGGFQWDTSLPLGAGIGTYKLRWYCSTATAASLADASMLWVGPIMTMTLVGGAPNAMRTAVTTSASPGASFSVDPDALPLVDRVGIEGDLAAKLKKQVDERSEDVARIQRMYGVFFGRHADPQGLDFWLRQLAKKPVRTVAAGMAASPEFQRGYGRLSDDDFVARLYENTLGREGDRSGRNFWGGRLSNKKQSRTEVALAFADSSEYIRRTADANYVVAAHQVLTGRTPSVAQIRQGVERLDAGGIKVQLVEDIALSVHDADWWASNT